MSSLRSQGRVSACCFTFADGRQCRTPRAAKHPHFCFDHARKESQARSADKLARELAYFLSGEYLSANDLSAALGRLVPAVVRGDIKPRAARTLAYLAQTLVQTIPLAQHPTSVDSKQLTANLNPSESTLMKNIGGWGCYG